MKGLFHLLRAAFCLPPPVGRLWFGKSTSRKYPYPVSLADCGNGRWTLTASRRIGDERESVRRGAEELVRTHGCVDLQVETTPPYQRWRLCQGEALIWGNLCRQWVVMARGGWVR